MPKFTSSMGETYYIKRGRKKNIPIIGCHGGPGGTHNSIKPLLELAEETKRQVVVFDQIGSGLSTHTKQKYWTIEALCKNLDDLIRHLGFKEVILHGASWGGTLILEYYKRYPHKVEGLIFHSSLISSKQWVEDAKRLIKKMPKKYQDIINACEGVGAQDSKVYKEATLEYYKRHVCRDPKAYQKPTGKLARKKKPRPNDELYNYMWGPSEFCPTGTLKTYNGISALKKVKVPTLFMSGEYDEATPQSALKFSKMVKGGIFKEIKGASHSSFREKKKETKKAISQFLSDFSL